MKTFILDACDIMEKLPKLQLQAAPPNPHIGTHADSLSLITDEYRQGLILRSSIFTHNYGMFSINKGVLPMDQSDDDFLYKAIQFYEHKVNELLQVQNNKLDDYIRPTYKSDSKTAWFRKAADFASLDWQGNELKTPFKFGVGRYQLALRAYYLFNGQHGTTNYRYSIIFKVVQLRFEPIKQSSMFVLDTPQQDKHDGDKKNRSDDQFDMTQPMIVWD